MGNKLLRPEEIVQAFNAHQDQYPPILRTDQVASMLGVPRKTIYDWAGKGRFNGSMRKRGKRLYFFRDRVIEQFFNGPQWN